MGRFLPNHGPMGISYGLSTWNPRVIQPSAAQVNAICAFGSGCTGVLVSERCVLTAAHCLTGIGDYCVSGANPWDNPRSVIWDGYETDELNLDWPASDLCLVRLNKKAINAAPIRIASPVGVTLVQAVGHGQKGPGEPRSAGARTWATGIIDWDHSNDKKIKVIFNDERNACFGDSGSPLLAMVGGHLCVVATLSTLGGPATHGTTDCRGYDAMYSRLDQQSGGRTAMDFIRTYSVYFDGSADCAMDSPVPAECLPLPGEPEPEPRREYSPPTPLPSRRRRELVPAPARPRSRFGAMLPLGIGAAAGILAAVVAHGRKR